MHTITYTGPHARELEVALAAVQEAAEVILHYYNSETASTYVKGDGSPVTDADLASDRTIREVILAAFPDDALLTEEGAKDLARIHNPRCWIADPIDGTAEYVARTGEFDVMLALAIDGRPVVAATIQPVTGLIQAAVAGQGAWEIRNGATKRFQLANAPTPPVIATSKYYGGLEPERGASIRAIASALHAEQPPVLEVGFQPRAFSEGLRKWDAFIGLPQVNRGSIAQEWDFACSDLITTEAGGKFTDCWGRLHRYNKRSTNISGGILASADPGLHDRLLDAISPELPPTLPALDPHDDDVPERVQ
jgi:3'-phosphoadenosine 5'-phosphosulfate (PAPS) 3'-phosphatase